MEREQIELPLLNTNEDKIAKPLAQVLNHITPKTTFDYVPELGDKQSFTKSLEELFPEQQYDKDIQKAKEILGELTSNFTTEQIKDVITKTQYLVDSWMDDFERNIFSGQTLKELLHEKGRL